MSINPKRYILLIFINTAILFLFTYSAIAELLISNDTIYIYSQHPMSISPSNNEYSLNLSIYPVPSEYHLKIQHIMNTNPIDEHSPDIFFIDNTMLFDTETYGIDMDAVYEFHDTPSKWIYINMNKYNASSHKRQGYIDELVAETTSSLTVWTSFPRELTEIQESAFSNVHASIIDLRNTKLNTIYSFAFSQNSSLLRVYLPASVTYIHADAFASCPNLVLCCLKGSYTESWAHQNGFETILLN